KSLVHHSVASRNCVSKAVLLTSGHEFNTWFDAPVNDAIALQRPLPNELLRIVARGEKSDGAPVADNAVRTDRGRRAHDRRGQREPLHDRKPLPVSLRLPGE